MKSVFTRSLAMIMALLMTLSIPVSAVEMVDAVRQEQEALQAQAAEETGIDPFDFTEGELSGEVIVPQQPQEEEPQQPRQYLAEDGSYLAPEELAVCVTAWTDADQKADTESRLDYTGIAVFYDYQKKQPQEGWDTPYFFYYEEGKLQDEKELEIRSAVYLELKTAPIWEPGAGEEPGRMVYMAEECYVEPEAEEHPAFNFLFNAEEQPNGPAESEPAAPEAEEEELDVESDPAAPQEEPETPVVPETPVEPEAPVVPEEEELDEESDTSDTTDISVELESLKQDEETGKKAVLTWKPCADAVSYQVFRQENEGEWIQQGEKLTADITTYTDETPQAGSVYSYCVQAELTEDRVTVLGQSVLTFQIRSQTEKVTLTAEPGKFILSWTAVQDAAGYRVLRNDGTGWKTLQDTKETTYTDEQLSNQTRYTYAVRCYYGSEMDTAQDYTDLSWSGPILSKTETYYTTPKAELAAAAGYIRVSWQPVEGLVGYRIYRRPLNSKGWTTLTDVGAGVRSYNDSSAVKGTFYQYTIRGLYQPNKVCSAYYNYDYRDQSAACSVKFNPVVSVAYDKTDLKITWTHDNAAVSYIVYRQDTAAKKWEIVARPAGNENDEYTDQASQLTSGKTYVYAVRAVYASGTSGYQASAPIKFCQIPVMGAIYSYKTGMYVSWGATPLAESYRVYRAEGTSGSWVRIGTSKTNTYVDQTAQNGKTYRYTVTACYPNQQYSKFIGSESYTYHAPCKVTIWKGEDKYGICWTPDANAKAYQILRGKKGESSPTVLARVTADKAQKLGKDLVYYDPYSNLTSGTDYTYYVRAYYGNGDINKEPYRKDNMWNDVNGVSLLYLAVPKMAVVAENTNDAVKVSWTAVAGAESYQIFRRQGTSGGYSLIDEVKNGSASTYIDKSKLTAGKEYSYTVVAAARSGKETSGYSRTGSYAFYLPTPLNQKCSENSGGGLKINWSTVAGVDQYLIYRRTETTKWALIGTTAGNQCYYVDPGATKEHLYLYTVRCQKKVTIGGKVYTIMSSYNTEGIMCGIPMAGDGWVHKDGYVYYVRHGVALVGWHYLQRNNRTYKYYFDPQTGRLATNLYNYFGKEYRDKKCRAEVFLTTKDGTRSCVTMYIYDEDKKEYCIPAFSVCCVGNIDVSGPRRQSGYCYMKKKAGIRWLDSETTFEQWATYIAGTPSWFHSVLYRTNSNSTLMSSTYNSLRSNNNNSNGCIRMQCIYAYLIMDIMKNGYGSQNVVPVIFKKRTSEVPPFGRPRMDRMAKKNYEPTDPAYTHTFFYETTVLGIHANGGSKNWTYY